MTNDERNPKPECRKGLGGASADFVIRSSSFFRICDARFMESPLSFFRMHWDHEPWCADLRSGPKASGTGVSPVCRSACSHGRDARATIGRFVETFFRSDLGYFATRAPALPGELKSSRHRKIRDGA